MNPMKLLAATIAALAVAATASAASATLQHDPRLDAVATDVAGFPLTVYGEDDPAAWAQESAGMSVVDPTGFTRIDQPVVYLAPPMWSALEQVETTGVQLPFSLDVPFAILTIVHEAEHQRMRSTDEGRVNACAIAAFPSVLSRDFGIPATVTTTRRRVVYSRRRVRVHGRYVTRRVSRTVSTSVTSANPIYVLLVQEAQEIYATEPPPYSTGVCS